MHYVLVVLMAILGAMFPGFLVKAIKSTDKMKQMVLFLAHELFWEC